MTGIKNGNQTIAFDPVIALHVFLLMQRTFPATRVAGLASEFPVLVLWVGFLRHAPNLPRRLAWAMASGMRYFASK